MGHSDVAGYRPPPYAPRQDRIRPSPLPLGRVAGAVEGELVLNLRRLAVLAALLLAACGGSTGPTSTPAGQVPTPAPTTAAPDGVTTANATGFPFATGTKVTTGALGVHGDNFACLDSRSSGDHCAPGYYSLAGSEVGDASLDLLAFEGTAVIPLAPGTVLAASPYCQTVLVDHGSGVWVEYVHLIPSVTSGQAVKRTSTLGTLAAAWPAPGHEGSCGLYSDSPHVHLAFVKGDSDAKTGTYVPMAGIPLCGHAVKANGGLEGLAGGKNAAFTVPACDIDGGAIAVKPTSTPTMKPTPSPTPSPAATPKPTPKPVAPKAPTGVTVSARGGGWIYCDGNTCFYEPSSLGPKKWRLAWNDVKSETGYRIYAASEGWYSVPDPDICIKYVQGPRHLIATLPANKTSLDGTWTAEGDYTKAHPFIYGSTYYVVAFNDSGASKRSASERIVYVSDVEECIETPP